MTENAPATAAVVVADPAGNIIGFDAGAEELFGHPANETIGRTLDVIVPAEMQDAHWKGFYRALDANHADLEGNPVHLPVLCRDGQVRVFPGVFRLLRDPHGNAVGAVATYSPAVEAEPFTPVPLG